MKKIKVAFCIPNMVIGGVETVLTGMLDQLDKSDTMDITIVLHQNRVADVHRQWLDAHPNIHVQVMYPLATFFEDLKKHTQIFPLENIRKIIFGAYKRLHRRRILRCDADVFIDYKNFSFRKEMRLVQKPKITWIHGSINYFNKSGHIAHVPEYDKIVCLTDDFMHDFQAEYPWASDKIIRIYNPVDVAHIRRMARIGEKYTGDEKYFCCVSRLDTDKDIPTLISAFDMFYARERHPECKLIIVGDGPAAGEFKEIANRMRAGKNIIFTGAMGNPFGYLGGAMAHVLSSRNEGFGMVLAEAGALGVLNISADCKSGPREVLMDGAAGQLFKTGNARQLSKIMSDVWGGRCGADEKIRAMTASLRRFDAHRIAAQMSDLIVQQVTK